MYVSAGAQAETQAAGLFAKGNTTAQFDNTSVCVIKPTAIRVGSAGKILDTLTSAFNVTALEMFYLDRTAVGEFLEVYRGVVPEYNAMCEEFTTGIILLLVCVSVCALCVCAQCVRA